MFGREAFLLSNLQSGAQTAYPPFVNEWLRSAEGVSPEDFKTAFKQSILPGEGGYGEMGCVLRVGGVVILGWLLITAYLSIIESGSVTPISTTYGGRCPPDKPQVGGSCISINLPEFQAPDLSLGQQTTGQQREQQLAPSQQAPSGGKGGCPNGEDPDLFNRCKKWSVTIGQWTY